MGDTTLNRHPQKALTAKFVESIKIKGKYFDCHGLFLRVTPKGTKQWVQRITINRKRTEIGLGSANVIPLSMARKNALENYIAAKSGQNPLAIESLLEGQAEALTQTAISKALEGDGLALRLCIERIAPAPKDKSVSFPLPDMKDAIDASKAASSVLTAVSEGELTPTLKQHASLGLSIATDALWS